MPAEESSISEWSREQDKQFEKAIASYPDNSPDRWERIAADVCGKSVEEIKHHYELLADDVKQIESGLIEVPCYNSSSDGSTSPPSDGATRKKDGKSSRLDQERRKGIAWTEEEHRLFLLGLDKYGKGDWRSISRNFVVTRNPTQVASHAQKYFIRLNSMNKDRRRSSIHDITSVDNGDVSVLITGSAGKSSKSPVMGQPIGGPLVSALGTPVSLPPPPHVGYYPVQHTPGHRSCANAGPL